MGTRSQMALQVLVVSTALIPAGVAGAADAPSRQESKPLAGYGIYPQRTTPSDRGVAQPLRGYGVYPQQPIQDGHLVVRNADQATAAGALNLASSDAFDWLDATVGAAVTVAAGLLTAASVVLVRRRVKSDTSPPTPAAST